MKTRRQCVHILWFLVCWLSIWAQWSLVMWDGILHELSVIQIRGRWKWRRRGWVDGRESTRPEGWLKGELCSGWLTPPAGRFTGSVRKEGFHWSQMALWDQSLDNHTMVSCAFWGCGQIMESYHIWVSGSGVKDYINKRPSTGISLSLFSGVADNAGCTEQGYLPFLYN